MFFLKEVRVQSNFLLFLYLLSFVLYIPIAILGLLLKPKAKTPTAPTPQTLLKEIQKNQKSFSKALKDFETYFLNSQSCDQETWFNLIQAILSSKWLQSSQAFQDKIKEANPSLQREINLLINKSLKNSK